MFLSIHQQLVDTLQSTISSTGLNIDLDAVAGSISFCDIEFGDFASNLGLTQAKKLHASPVEIAQVLADHLQTTDLIVSAEVVAPGFLNIRLSDAFWLKQLSGLTENFYASQRGQDRRVNIEFISANPTGPLVLVNAWGGFYGDILARVYASQGYDVTREYYLNDGGNQIIQLGRAIQQAAGKEFSAIESAELYRGPYIDKLAIDLSDELGSTQTLLGADPQAIGEKAQRVIFSQLIQPTLQRLGIHHDVVTPETSLDNQATIQALVAHDGVIERDGATWLKGSAAGLSKDEVLVRSTDNQETYFLKDITYQIGKLKGRNFDTAITIVGPDHHGQERRLVATLDLLGVTGFIPLWTQTVRLIRDGQEFKMSKRRGNYIVLDDFLDTVAPETARFFFAMRDTNSHFDLDLDLLAQQNKHNPLYYVMYAYARTQSVLSKSGLDHEALQQTVEVGQISVEERRLIRSIVQLDEKITSTIDTQEIHPILHQLIAVASDFHDWYERHPILQAPLEKRPARLMVAYRAACVLAGTLKLLGITPLEKM